MTISYSYRGYDLEEASVIFDKKVKDFMKNGWTAQGGVSLSSYLDFEGKLHYLFAQAIVLLED